MAKKKKNSAKEWLLENKIYFEVLSLTILGLASIIVAILSWKSSERQVELSELEHIPIIHVKKEIKDSIPVLNIYNVGEPAFNVNAQSLAILSVKNVYYFDNKTERPAEYLFSISSYYKYMATSENIDGNIATIVLNEDEYFESQRLKKEFYDLESNKEFFMFEFELLAINYEDIEGRRYEKHFMIDRRGTEISIKKYDSIYNRFSVKGQYLDLDEIKALNAKKAIARVSLENTKYVAPIKAKLIRAVEIRRGE